MWSDASFVTTSCRPAPVLLPHPPPFSASAAAAAAAAVDVEIEFVDMAHRSIITQMMRFARRRRRHLQLQPATARDFPAGRDATSTDNYSRGAQSEIAARRRPRRSRYICLLIHFHLPPCLRRASTSSQRMLESFFPVCESQLSQKTF